MSKLTIEAGKGGEDAGLFVGQLASAITKATSVKHTIVNGDASFDIPSSL